METPTKKPSKPYVPRRAALNGVDFLVIAATVLTFAAAVLVNQPHAKSPEQPGKLTAALPASQLSGQAAPTKGRNQAGERQLLDIAGDPS